MSEALSAEDLKAIMEAAKEAMDEFWDDEHCDCGHAHPSMERIRLILEGSKDG